MRTRVASRQTRIPGRNMGKGAHRARAPSEKASVLTSRSYAAAAISRGPTSVIV